jgi:hypothetical protein
MSWTKSPSRLWNHSHLWTGSIFTGKESLSRYRILYGPGRNKGIDCSKILLR